MRRALGLDHEPAFPRSQQAVRAADRQPHGRRFAVDGQVPVVLVNRRDHSTDSLTSQSTAASVNRLVVAESALKGEQDARARAERALNDAQAVIRELQTRLGHAVLAQDEAVDAGRCAENARLAAASALDAERAARQKAEDALHRALDGRMSAVERRRLTNVAGIVSEGAEAPAKRRGRPPGSKNRLVTLRVDAQQAYPPAPEDAAFVAHRSAAMVPESADVPARRRGRQPGSRTQLPTVRVKEPKPVRWW